MTPQSKVNPFLAGALGRCPVCGRGALFKTFLGLAETCTACGFPLGRSESGDGPAVFVILIVGFIAVFGLLVTFVALRPPIWLLLATWAPLSGLLCLALLRPVKGLMVAAQIRNNASEHRNDSTL